jgi:imidazoleglycerol-phosphate dehydratase/histidinol-phosphatase
MNWIMVGYGDQPRWFRERTVFLKTFWPTQNFILRAFENEGILLTIFFVDRSFPEDNAPHVNRTGMLTKYIDLGLRSGQFIRLGDRLTDVELAKTSGLKLFSLITTEGIASNEIAAKEKKWIL